MSNSTLRRPALDLSISSNLYITDEQGCWFEEVMADPQYQLNVSDALGSGESAWLDLLNKTKLRSKHRRITVVDCGPANPQESIRKLAKLMRAVTVAEYVVIDMNDHLLSKIKSHVAGALGIPSRFIRSRFEDLHQESIGDAAAEDTLLLFGSTEMNYEADELAGVLRNFCTPGMLLAFEGLVRANDGSTVGYESEVVQRFAFGPLWLLGAEQKQFEFHPTFLDDRIILEFVAKESVEFNVDGFPVVQKSDAVWTAFSRRPTFEQYKESFATFANPIGTMISDRRIASSLGHYR
jgi:hypothetical protein